MARGLLLAPLLRAADVWAGHPVVEVQLVFGGVSVQAVQAAPRGRGSLAPRRSLSALSQEERRVSQWQRQALEDPLCGCVAGLGSVGAQHCRVVRPCFALGGRPLATAPTVATVATLFLRPHDR